MPRSASPVDLFAVPRRPVVCAKCGPLAYALLRGETTDIAALAGVRFQVTFPVTGAPIVAPHPANTVLQASAARRHAATVETTADAATTFSCPECSGPVSRPAPATPALMSAEEAARAVASGAAAAWQPLGTAAAEAFLATVPAYDVTSYPSEEGDGLMIEPAVDGQYLRRDEVIALLAAWIPPIR